jgi:hypothetical protein
LTRAEAKAEAWRRWGTPTGSKPGSRYGWVRQRTRTAPAGHRFNVGQSVILDGGRGALPVESGHGESWEAAFANAAPISLPPGRFTHDMIEFPHAIACAGCRANGLRGALCNACGTPTSIREGMCTQGRCRSCCTGDREHGVGRPVQR